MTSESDGPAHVDALPVAHGGEEAGRLVVGELLDQLRLGQVALAEDRMVDAVLDRIGRLAHHAMAGEQRQRATAGGVDQPGQLVEHRRRVVGVARLGQVGRAVQEALLLEVERGADVEHLDLVGGDAQVVDQASAGRWRW